MLSTALPRAARLAVGLPPPASSPSTQRSAAPAVLELGAWLLASDAEAAMGAEGSGDADQAGQSHNGGNTVTEKSGPGFWTTRVHHSTTEIIAFSIYNCIGALCLSTDGLLGWICVCGTYYAGAEACARLAEAAEVVLEEVAALLGAGGGWLPLADPRAKAYVNELCKVWRRAAPWCT